MSTSNAQKVLDFYQNDPARWTQGAFAKNKDGVPWHSGSPDATCWCLLGAAYLVLEGEGETWRECQRLAGDLGFSSYGSMSSWNDEPGRTFEEVKARLQLAAQGSDA